MTSLTLPDWLTPREYQSEAVTAWESGKGQGILNMATGTGKTVTSLIAATDLYTLQDDRLALVVAAPFRHLVDQWTNNLKQFGATPFRAYGSRTTWTEDVAGTITEFTSGVRDLLTIVTTHKTFATDHFQRLLSRVDGSETMLIADEVHHMGAPHVRQFLPRGVRARLGLSATPERWYDDEGTDALLAYFSNGIVYEYGLGEAIADGHLTEYYYVPHIIELTDDEAESYLALSKAIGRILADNDGSTGGAIDITSDEQLQRLLIKRSRLVGTARNKVQTLETLLTEINPESLHHALIYCGDGSVNVESDSESSISTSSGESEVKRQLRVVTELLGTELGVHAHQFTYKETQDTRQRLLTEFEAGSLQALVAIRCLDEGVDVPATETAFMLASSSNPRQFVQRRGRILRTHEHKDYSIIHDFIVAPPTPTSGNSDTDTFSIERQLLKSELQRVATFTEHAK
ncbi:MAG: DNA or RNA helicase of superfamily II, partial [Haloquadratum sp. J07HQX50]